MRTPTNQTTAVDQAKRLCRRIDRNFIELGQVLWIIQSNGWFTPFPAFSAFCEGEMKIGYRKACYLIKIAMAMEEGRITKAVALELGWTKTSMICDVVTAENMREWRRIAKEKTSSQLIAMVKNIMLGEFSKEECIAVVFNFTERERASVYAALEDNGAEPHGQGLRGREQALLRIIQRDRQAGPHLAPRDEEELGPIVFSLE